MPISSSLDEEGLLLSPRFLMRSGQLQEDCWGDILSGLRGESDTQGDFRAQIAANQKGTLRLVKIVDGFGVDLFIQGLIQLNHYGEELARSYYQKIPDGIYQVKDFMDDDGQGNIGIPVCLSMVVSGSSIELDFAGTSRQVSGNINCPISVASAAAYYVFRCLLPLSLIHI